MPFDFTCPFCHTQTKVDDKYAGQTGGCVGCGKTITLPVPYGLVRNKSSSKNDSTSDSDSSNSEAVIGQSSTGQSYGSYNSDGLRQHRSIVPIIAISTAVVVLSASIGLVGFLGLPHAKRILAINEQRQDLVNMQKIVKALGAYYDRYQSFPPATVRAPSDNSKPGKPLYSWRVLILPFLGYEHIYSQFALDQPHDSPANLQAAQQMPKEFASIKTNSNLSTEASFALITGHGTIFPPTGPLARDGIDKPTIILVDYVSDGKLWSEPEDIDSSHGLRPGERPGKDLGGLHEDHFLGVSVDGEMFTFPNTISGNVIDALVSPYGQEIVDVQPYEFTQ